MKFFSVIIPLHNSAATLDELLQNIREQDEDIEVVIANDSSTDNWEEVVSKYNDLDIVKVECHEKVHCPGNTRQAGLNKATGEWITFIDHDDLFAKDAFKNVRARIKEKNLDIYCFTMFDEVQYDCVDDVVANYSANNSATWMHGKFYNRKNCIEKLNLRFYKDLATHEDVFFNHNLMAKLVLFNITGGVMEFQEDLLTYHWRNWPNSTSRQWGPTFIYDNMKDYILALSHPYLSLIRDWNNQHPGLYIEKELPEFMKWAKAKAMNDFMSMYFYYQGDCFHRHENRNIESYNEILKFFVEMIRTVRLDINSIVVNGCFNADYYYTAKEACQIATGRIVEMQSFKDFVYGLA